ncbi:DUF1800 family protein [Erythrobacter sp. NE805]|uniref:DUF1800 domain-containing protein n=1 Tax=Erythrobacter sp. NE805 TaxID=3389875 RepID=UPI00396B05FB
MSSNQVTQSSQSTTGSSSQTVSGGTALAALAVATTGAAVVTSGGATLTSTSDAMRVQGTAESRKAAARAGLQASLGVTAAIIDEIDRIGIEEWLDREMAAPNDENSVSFFSSRGLDAIDSNGHWRNEVNFDPMIWAQLMAGGSSVRKRMALALSEIFVVSLTGLNLPWKAQAVGAYWDILNRHAFSSFGQLLEAVTLSPAMGAYLNMAGNRAADPNTGRVPDENFAREIMQLFTIGLVQLNPDGTPILVRGREIPTYSNADVQGLAKVFTGFDLDYQGVSMVRPPIPHAPVPTVQLVRQPMTADPSRWFPRLSQSTHSPDEKSFLGVTIPGGLPPISTLRWALNVLVNHPNVGPFIGKQLIQRLVTSNPSRAYVARVASAFNNNGYGKRGDLGAVFKAIILDPEASSADSITSPFFGKVREPVLRYAQWGRTFGARSTSGSWRIRNMGVETLLNQAPCRSPSVFNFFRPEYVAPKTQSAANGMVAPELQIATENAVAEYTNVIHRTVRDSVYWYDDIKADYSFEISLAADPDKLLDHLDLVLTAGQISQFTRDTVLDVIRSTRINATNELPGRLQRVQDAITLIMVSNDYIVQK